jgi:hypothetical protein
MKIRKSSIFVGFVIVFFLSGCGQYVRPLTRMKIGTERVFDKNYEVGKIQSVYVGQPVVKVKDYQVNRFSANFMQASDDFLISSTNGDVIVKGTKNTDYPVRGLTTIDNQDFTVLDLPSDYDIFKEKFKVHWKYGFAVLIKYDGSVHDKAMLDGIVFRPKFKSAPPDLRFFPSKDEEIELDSGYLNYELIYGGTDGKLITMTYREYTPDNFARPAFFQDLVYEARKSEIRFRDTAVKIHEATNEKIVYTVLSDGLGAEFD